jgi:hypothetical protein
MRTLTSCQWEYKLVLLSWRVVQFTEEVPTLRSQRILKEILTHAHKDKNKSTHCNLFMLAKTYNHLNTHQQNRYAVGHTIKCYIALEMNSLIISECLLCTRHCSGYLGYPSEQNTAILVLVEFTLQLKLHVPQIEIRKLKNDRYNTVSAHIHDNILMRIFMNTYL